MDNLLKDNLLEKVQKAESRCDEVRRRYDGELSAKVTTNSKQAAIYGLGDIREISKVWGEVRSAELEYIHALRQYCASTA